MILQNSGKHKFDFIVLLLIAIDLQAMTNILGNFFLQAQKMFNVREFL